MISYTNWGEASLEEVKRKQDEGEDLELQTVERDREVQIQEQRNRINEAQYQTIYEKILVPWLPKYLADNNSSQKLIARFRCGNEANSNKFWEDEVKKTCRTCDEAPETMQHLLQCMGIGEELREVESILEESGSGESWMKKVIRLRERNLSNVRC